MGPGLYLSESSEDGHSCSYWGEKNLDWVNSNDFSISLIVSLEILLLRLTYCFYTVGWVFREERMFQRCG